MRAIIMCAGKGTRWGGSVPKHLVDVEGEILLHRTVRQLMERGVSDIRIASHDPRYDVPGARRFDPLDHPFDVDKFWSAREHWDAPYVVHFYGDVYYSDGAMDRITGDPAPDDFRLYARRFRSRITGTKHGECFALAFTDHELMSRACVHVRREHAAGRIRRGGSWELYQVLCGRPPNPYGLQPIDHRFAEIDDWTEDFDTMDEYEEWTRRRAAARPRGANAPIP